MCGRFYINREMVNELAGLAGQINEEADPIDKTDVYPTDTTWVLTPNAGKTLTATVMKWGFPGRDKGLVINARAETIRERKLFQDSVEKRRCLVPVRGFYEWSKAKEKVEFEDQNKPVLYLAGIYKRIDNQNCFVIITTAANESVSRTHDRMPLVIEKAEITDWFDDRKYGSLLKKVPRPLKKSQEFEQQSLFYGGGYDLHSKLDAKRCPGSGGGLKQ